MGRENRALSSSFDGFRVVYGRLLNGFPTAVSGTPGSEPRRGPRAALGGDARLCGLDRHGSQRRPAPHSSAAAAAAGIIWNSHRHVSEDARGSGQNNIGPSAGSRREGLRRPGGPARLRGRAWRDATRAGGTPARGQSGAGSPERKHCHCQQSASQRRRRAAGVRHISSERAGQRNRRRGCWRSTRSTNRPR